MMTLAEKLLMGSGKIALEAADPSTYVEFVSSTPMTITPKYTNSGVTLQYSVDGTSWTPITSGGTTSSANIIYFRGQATGTKRLYTSGANFNTWKFTGATNLECNGKLDRLIQDTLGGDNDILTISTLCFAYMFRNTTSLIKAPELPATTLGTACYDSMFYGCTGLKLSTTMTGIYDTAYRIPTAGMGTTGTDALKNMFTDTGGTFTGTPEINTTYYTENTPV